MIYSVCFGDGEVVCFGDTEISQWITLADNRLNQAPC